VEAIRARRGDEWPGRLFSSAAKRVKRAVATGRRHAISLVTPDPAGSDSPANPARLNLRTLRDRAIEPVLWPRRGESRRRASSSTHRPFARSQRLPPADAPIPTPPTSRGAATSTSSGCLSRGATHSRNLRANDSAAIAVYDSRQRGKPDRGIQIFDSAHEGRGEDAEHAEALYTKRFPDFAEADLSAYRFYLFRPRRLKVFDERHTGGCHVRDRARRSRTAARWEQTEMYRSTA